MKCLCGQRLEEWKPNQVDLLFPKLQVRWITERITWLGWEGLLGLTLGNHKAVSKASETGLFAGIVWLEEPPAD